MVTREQVLEAADIVARREGIDRLTIRAICAQLGVTQPAIYRYFPAKHEIVELVIDRVIERMELPGPEVGYWIARLRRCFISAHDEVAPYDGLAARMGHEMPRSPAAARNSAYLGGLLAEAGIGETDSLRITRAVFVYTWGHLLTAEATASTFEDNAGPGAPREQFLWGLDHLLASFRRAVEIGELRSAASTAERPAARSSQRAKAGGRRPA
jgi:AcrR family transcriptional regulator